MLGQRQHCKCLQQHEYTMLAGCQSGVKRRRQDSNLRGQSPVDFGSTPLTAWVRLLLGLVCTMQVETVPHQACAWFGATPAWRNGSASVSGAGGCGFDPHRGCFVHIFKAAFAQQGQPWSSGMMDPSQGFDPGSIPGGCTFSFVCRPQRSSIGRACDCRYLRSQGRWFDSGR